MMRQSVYCKIAVNTDYSNMVIWRVAYNMKHLSSETAVQNNNKKHTHYLKKENTSRGGGGRVKGRKERGGGKDTFHTDFTK